MAVFLNIYLIPGHFGDYTCKVLCYPKSFGSCFYKVIFYPSHLVTTYAGCDITYLVLTITCSAGCGRTGTILVLDYIATLIKLGVSHS